MSEDGILSRGAMKSGSGSFPICIRKSKFAAGLPGGEQGKSDEHFFSNGLL